MKRRLNHVIIALIICGFLAPAPTVVSASITEFVVGAASDCAKAYFMQKAAEELKKRIQEFVSAKIASTLQDSVGIGAVPVKDSGVRSSTSTTAKEVQKSNIKEEVKDSMARCFARYMLDSEILGMLDLVRESGRDGGSTFIRNWQNFLTNATYRGEGILRAELAGTELCDYMEGDIWSIFGVTKRDRIPLTGQNLRVGDLDPFRLRQQCTMPNGFSLATIQKDFEEGGGWAAVAQMLQPENNPNWTYLNAYDELQKRRALEVAADTQQAAAGQGNIGISGKNARASCLVKGSNGTCLFYKDIQTPGSYITATLAATINQELNWFTAADELNEVLLKLFDRLTGRLSNLLEPEERPVYDSDPASPLDCEPLETTTPSPTPTYVTWAWGTQGRTSRERQLVNDITAAKEDMADVLIGYLDEWVNDTTTFAPFSTAFRTAGASQALITELQDAIGEYILDQQTNHGNNLNTIRSNIYNIFLRGIDAILKARYSLIQQQSITLPTNHTNILNLFQISDRADATDDLDAFDDAAQELATGIDPTAVGDDVATCGAEWCKQCFGRCPARLDGGCTTPPEWPQDCISDPLTPAYALFYGGINLWIRSNGERLLWQIDDPGQDPNDYRTWHWYEGAPASDYTFWCSQDTEYQKRSPPNIAPPLPPNIRCVDGSDGGIGRLNYPLCPLTIGKTPETCYSRRLLEAECPQGDLYPEPVTPTEDGGATPTPTPTSIPSPTPTGTGTGLE